MTQIFENPVKQPLLPSSWLIQKDATASYYEVPADGLEEIILVLKALESRLVWLFCTEPATEGSRLWYVFERGETPEFLVLVLKAENPVSIATFYPVASRFERVITDGFGIRFSDSLDNRRLLLHERYPDGFHPVKKSFQNTSLQSVDSWAPYEFQLMGGTSVYQVPVGPVHAGIIEPGHFRFSVIGETILNLEIRLGYLHRGIEKLAEGHVPAFCVAVAESISGDESVSNACCYVMAVERIASTQVPGRAVCLRLLLLELERSYSLLSDLAGMVTDIAFSASASRFLIIREELQRLCERLTGSRFLKGMIIIGGISHDIPDELLREAKDVAIKAVSDLDTVLTWTMTIPSVIDRFATTGVVREPLIDQLSLSGPVARASGSSLDVRISHPYGGYEQYSPVLAQKNNGDVLARFLLKGEEVLSSLKYIIALIPEIPAGQVHTHVDINDGYALSAVESPRGRTLFWVHIQNGQIERYAVSTASFCNWMALEHAVMGNIVPDFPVINKSLNLSYAGTDL